MVDDDRGATGVTVEGTAQVGGTIARVEQRPFGKMGRFFACLQKRLG